MRWWRRREREQDLEREIRCDLELEAKEREANGLSPQDARYAARRAFGNVTWVKEEVWVVWGWTLWETIFRELRYAARTLQRSPGFALTAFLTLAVGIGASTAVFTVVDSVLLKPLAFHESGRLVACWERVRSIGDDATGPNSRHVEVWRQRATAFSGLTYFQNTDMGLTLGAEPVFAGVITGLVASLVAGRAIQSLLYGTRAVDPSVILVVTGVFLLSAAAAAFLPARRAASVDPMEALRSE